MMNLIIKLKEISENKDSQLLVKLYLLDCCQKLVKFRSSGCLSKNIKVARGFLRGYKTKMQMHQAEWEIEGDAFCVEQYSEYREGAKGEANKSIKCDLLKLKHLKGLSIPKNKRYLEEMAYFLDHVFAHIEYTPNWLFTKECEKFMCPIYFNKYFGKKV